MGDFCSPIGNFEELMLISGVCYFFYLDGEISADPYGCAGHL